jgi:hypothetical protein
VQHYYQMFDTNRPALQSLYQEGSMLSFESEQFMGIQAIMTKLTTLKFSTVLHQARGRAAPGTQPSARGEHPILVRYVKRGLTAASMSLGQTGAALIRRPFLI